MPSIPEGSRFAGNIVVGQESEASLDAEAPNTGPGKLIDDDVFLEPGDPELRDIGAINVP